jgi:hypothetical protein
MEKTAHPHACQSAGLDHATRAPAAPGPCLPVYLPTHASIAPARRPSRRLPQSAGGTAVIRGMLAAMRSSACSRPRLPAQMVRHAKTRASRHLLFKSPAIAPDRLPTMSSRPPARACLPRTRRVKRKRGRGLNIMRRYGSFVACRDRTHRRAFAAAITLHYVT